MEEAKIKTKLWAYLYVETKVNNCCPDVFIAELNRELIGHVLKVVQQWAWRNQDDFNYKKVLQRFFK